MVYHRSHAALDNRSISSIDAVLLYQILSAGYYLHWWQYDTSEMIRRELVVHIPMIAAASVEIVPNDSSCFAIALTLDCRSVQ